MFAISVPRVQSAGAVVLIGGGLVAVSPPAGLVPPILVTLPGPLGLPLLVNNNIIAAALNAPVAGGGGAGALLMNLVQIGIINAVNPLAVAAALPPGNLVLNAPAIAINGAIPLLSVPFVSAAGVAGFLTFDVPVPGIIRLIGVAHPGMHADGDTEHDGSNGPNTEFYSNQTPNTDANSSSSKHSFPSPSREFDNQE
jgi:hypothetical protein